MLNKTLIIALSTAFALTACQNESAAPAASAAPTATASETASAATAASASSSNSANIQVTDIRKDNIGGDFTLIDGKGQPFSLSSLKGKAVILAFGFTNCPDVCPTELYIYNEAIKQLGEQGKDVAVVFVSVDPERDTPELIGKYVAQFNPEFIGLTDTQNGRDIALVKQQYRIVSAKTEIKSDTMYNVDHSSGAYIINKNGEAVYFAPYGIEAPQLAADLKKVLSE